MFEQSRPTTRRLSSSISSFRSLRVFYADENTRIFIDRLSGFNAPIVPIGVSYDNLVATLQSNFTEKKASAAPRRNQKTDDSAHLRQSGHRGSVPKNFDEQWLQNLR